MYIKKFGNFITEKYEAISINSGDDETAVFYDHKRLDIINKYFPYVKVTGKTDWVNGIVNLSFDEGLITIKGEYNATDQKMPSIFTINDNGKGYDYQFNWHPYAMSGVDISQFEDEIKAIHDNYNTFTLVLANDNYGIFNLGEFKSEVEALNKLKEYSIVLERGKHTDGKLLKNFKEIHKF